MRNNSLIKKCLCISMVSSMIISSTSLILASVETQQNSQNYSSSYTDKEKNDKWWKKIEAETGEKTGKVIFEKPNNVNSSGTMVRYIGNGEENSLTITVNTEFTDNVKMKIRYVSGENRNLSYKVNNDQEVNLKDLNSGSWNDLKDSEAYDIKLNKGENKIKFYLTNGNAPDIDYITFSRNGGTEEDMQGKDKITVKFTANNQQVGESIIKKSNEIIPIDVVPKDPNKEGKDFLGWYWGPNLKYEAIFPLDLSKLPKDVLNNLDGELTFTARFGKNIEGNPVEKDGYRLIFQEEFSGKELDKNKWVDKYLSSWSTEAKNTKEWEVKDGEMNLQIKDTTQPWCPEYDEQTVVSGFTTGQRNALHNWNRKNQVRNPSDTELTHINQYGYYEIRAKAQSGSSRHSAWWLLGFEDVSEESAEIDIFEILGKNDHAVPSALHSWNDSDAFRNPDFGLGSYVDNNKDFNNEYHVYGFDWQKGTGSGNLPDKIIFYVDGVKWKEENVNIDYPMIQLFSLYEKREGGWTGNWEWMPYPNSFNIDYVRVYKKLPEGQKELSKDQLQVLNIRAEDITLKQDEIQLKTYGNYTEKNLPGTKSYVRVDWNDGVETQEPVQWDPITKEDLETLKNGKSIVKKGFVKSINKETQMKINVSEKDPYSMNNLTPLSKDSLSYLFDGLINESNSKSGEFRFTNDEKKDVYFEYDFKKDVELSGVDVWTNFGSGQGIKKAKISTWNDETNSWEIVKDENNQDKVYDLNWTTSEEQAEKISLDIPKTKTSKVRIYVLDANTKWDNKFSVREIQFNKTDIQSDLLSLEITPPTKTEYIAGEKLDLSGMKVKAKYSDGTNVDITNEATISDIDMSTTGEKVVAVNYKDKTATFKILVKEAVKPQPPVDSEKPTDQGQKPSNIDKTQKPSPKPNIAKTSDELPTIEVLSLLIASLTAVIVFFKKRFN